MHKASLTAVSGLNLIAEDESDRARAATWVLLTTGSPFELNNPTTSTLTLTGSLDYETDRQYILTIKATDQADSNFSATIAVTVDVTNIIEAFTISNTASGDINIRTNAARGDTPSNLALIIRDENDNDPGVATWRLQIPNPIFSINPNNGTIIIEDDSTIGNVSSMTSVAVIAEKVIDGARIVSNPFSIIIGIITTALTVEDSMDATPNTIAENAAASDPVVGLRLEVKNGEGNTVATGVTWSIPDTNSPFSITDGTVSIKAGSSLNYEAATEYSVVVQARVVNPDNLGGIEIPIIVMIQVTNLFEELVIRDTHTAPNTIAENAAANTAVSGLNLIAQDEGNRVRTASWTLLTTGSPFAISNSSTSTITLTGSLNYETAAQYALTVMATDSADTRFTQTIEVMIQVINLFESLSIVDTDAAANTIAENAAANATVVSGLHLITQDEAVRARTATWELLTTGTPFELSNPTTSTITLTGSLNYEATTQYTLTVMATDSVDSNFSATIAVTVDVTNLIEAFTITNTASSTPTVAPSAQNGDRVEQIRFEVRDENNEAIEGVAWSLMPASTTFAINPVSGQVTVNAANELVLGRALEINVVASKGSIISETLVINIDVATINALRLYIKVFLEGPLQ